MNSYTTKSRIFQKQKKRRLIRKKKRNKIIFISIASITVVLLGIVMFKGGIRIGEKIKYPVSYSNYISKYSKEYDLDPYLVMAVIKQESNFIADAKSPYAGGLMQLTETTANEYAKKLGMKNYDYMDPETNINIGCFVLSSLIEKYGVIDTALAAYNAGIGNVNGWLVNPDYSYDGKTLYKIPYPETKHYVHKIKKYMDEYKNRVDIRDSEVLH